MGRVIRAGLLVPVLAGIGAVGVARAQDVSVPDAAPAAAGAGASINAGQVNGTGGGAVADVPGATEAPTQQQIFQSGEPLAKLWGGWRRISPSSLNVGQHLMI